MILFSIFLYVLCNINSAVSEIIKHGNVSHQNLVVYDIENPKNVYLKLISESGDADIYLFKWSSFDKTKINFSNYEFKSESFGKDEIIIGRDYDYPSHIVVYGAAQEDSKYVLEISTIVTGDLDYITIDEFVQHSAGASYEELCLQHSFDSDAFYAQEEKARQKLLSMDSYPSAEQYRQTGPSKQKKSTFKEESKEKIRKQRGSDHKKSSIIDEDSFLYHFLLWLLEFIVDAFF